MEKTEKRDTEKWKHIEKQKKRHTKQNETQNTRDTFRDH